MNSGWVEGMVIYIKKCVEVVSRLFRKTMLASFHNFISGLPGISGWMHPIVLGRKAAIDLSTS
jgi:hypothetical protein